VIADNAGYDSAELVSQIRAAKSQRPHTMGIDMIEGRMGDMAELGVLEFRVKHQMLLSATEAAGMIMRVDDIIKAPLRPRQPDRRH
jgi:T-complex protein 1 subunit beta